MSGESEITIPCECDRTETEPAKVGKYGRSYVGTCENYDELFNVDYRCRSQYDVDLYHCVRTELLAILEDCEQQAMNADSRDYQHFQLINSRVLRRVLHMISRGYTRDKIAGHCLAMFDLICARAAQGHVAVSLGTSDTELDADPVRPESIVGAIGIYASILRLLKNVDYPTEGWERTPTKPHLVDNSFLRA